jgi:hypothetical protein
MTSARKANATHTVAYRNPLRAVSLSAHKTRRCIQVIPGNRQHHVFIMYLPLMRSPEPSPLATTFTHRSATQRLRFAKDRQWRTGRNAQTPANWPLRQILAQSRYCSSPNSSIRLTFKAGGQVRPGQARAHRVPRMHRGARACQCPLGAAQSVRQ